MSNCTYITILVFDESRVLENIATSRVNEAEMSCLINMCGIARKDRVRKGKIRNRCGLQKA